MLAGILAPVGAAALQKVWPDPRGLDFDEWSAALLQHYGSVEPSWKPWRLWAADMIARDVFSDRTLPDPHEFEDWGDWALASLRS